jgi:hypothetical protein
MLPAAEHVDEFQIDHFGLGLLGKPEEVVNGHGHSSLFRWRFYSQQRHVHHRPARTV